MKTCKLKFAWLLCLAVIFIATLSMGVVSAFAADEQKSYDESYRNKLAYSPYRGWNNDPNGLLYADGVYHMYYQYNQNAEHLDEHIGDEQYKKDANGWGNICWAHAVSSDLVHWEQRGVAISANQTVGDNFYGLFFSGSAVYDGNNTSGLFEGEKGGVVAVMTQPLWNAELGYDVQRQVLCYSGDGDNFTVYGEILAHDEDGGLGDNEFRDPKVFWNEKLNKWLMVVGGGSVRMYCSDNLIDWEYLGETGFWGECPDLSRFEVNGEEKYVLIISPEDKTKSHEYNGTNRVNTYYPAEYYTVGELDENGLFRSVQPLKRLSEGIDSYAFQSFNNSPDGKVYGISWAASWLTVGEYEPLRKNYNGGMTVACELRLEEADGEYILRRTPVKAFESLRGEKKEINGVQEAGKNIFAGVRATEADIEAELDFSGSTATYAELSLRVSDAERIILRYDAATETLTLDRSQSSLIARDTKFFKDTYGKRVPLNDNKLSLRILLDRAFISVFANDGYASYFSAVFPSAISNGIRLLSDGALGVKAEIYSVNGIFGDAESVKELILTTNKIDMTVGELYPVIASSYGFDADEVKFEVTEGAENVSVEKINGVAYIKALKKGSAKIDVQGQTLEVYIYENGYAGDVKFTERYRGFSYIREDGLFFGAGAEDAFLFGDASGKDFTYSAYFTPLNDAQAGGLVIGYTGNASGFWFVTADIKENRVKLVKFCGEKEAPKLIRSVKYDFAGASRFKLAVSVCGGEVRAFVNDESTAVIICKLANYAGGRVGLNIFNSQMAINRVVFKNTFDAENSFTVGGETVKKVVNVTDGSYRLKNGEYSVEGGKLRISDVYLSTLEADTEYTFRVVTAFTQFDMKVKTSFASATVTPLKGEYRKGDTLTLAVSGGAEVYKVEINGKACSFTKADSVITVDAEQLKSLTGGTHTVKVYTAKGRPSASFTLLGLDDFREEEVEIISHTFFYIDIAIFATLIIAYAAFVVIRKFRAK